MKRLEPRQFLPLEIIIWLGPRGFIPPLISSKFLLDEFLIFIPKAHTFSNGKEAF